MSAPDTVPGYPYLKRVAETDHGIATLLEVNVTSDGFLIGWASFADEDGNEVEQHSVFLGRAR